MSKILLWGHLIIDPAILKGGMRSDSRNYFDPDIPRAL